MGGVCPFFVRLFLLVLLHQTSSIKHRYSYLQWFSNSLSTQVCCVCRWLHRDHLPRCQSEASIKNILIVEYSYSSQLFIYLAAQEQKKGRRRSEVILISWRGEKQSRVLYQTILFVWLPLDCEAQTGWFCCLLIWDTALIQTWFRAAVILPETARQAEICCLLILADGDMPGL